MNIILPEKEKTSKRVIALYTISIAICIISIIVIVCSKNLEEKTIDEMIFEKMHSTTQAELDEQLLKSEFQNLFQNKLENNTYIETKESKKEQDKEIIYTKYSMEESKENRYYININIPYINLDNDFANKYNEEIEKIFVQKVKNILRMDEGNAIYSVKYEANIEDGILYVMIHSDLKENSSAQRTIIQTYQYDLEQGKEISLIELIDKKNINKVAIQNKVKEEIKKEQKKVEDLKSLGYSIFERDAESEIYNIENTKEFFMKNGKLYLIYAYGNENFTSELDVIII